MNRILTPAVVIGAVLAAYAPPARGESVVMSVDRPTTLHFLRAATPYTFEVGQGDLTETFTLYNPRDLRFEDGVIRLTIDCKGEPIPLEAVLEPTMTVTFDRQKGAFVAKVESLPVRIGGMGAIHLDRYLDPVIIPVSFTQALDIGVPGLSVDTVIRELKVHPDRIEAKADLVFRKAPPISRK